MRCDTVCDFVQECNIQMQYNEKTLLLIYLIVGSCIFAVVLAGTLFLSAFSIKYDVLSNYNACQIIMFVIVLSQWLGEQLLGDGENSR